MFYPATGQPGLSWINGPLSGLLLLSVSDDVFKSEKTEKVRLWYESDDLIVRELLLKLGVCSFLLMSHCIVDITLKLFRVAPKYKTAKPLLFMV